MSRCAVCQVSDNIVVNVIIADPTIDPPPENTYLVEILDGVRCDIGWKYDGVIFLDTINNI